VAGIITADAVICFRKFLRVAITFGVLNEKLQMNWHPCKSY
jgi:hypothetical protein